MPPRREAGEIPAARAMAIAAAVSFAALIAALVTTPSIRSAASWAGAGMVGLAAVLLGVWLLVLRSIAEAPTRRRNDDYLIAGVAVLSAMLGFAAFAAGAIG